MAELNNRHRGVNPGNLAREPRLAILRSPKMVAGIALIAALVAIAYAAWRSNPPAALPDHRHDPGEHGGLIVAVGQDHYHVEALLAEGGVFKLFTLAQDQSRVLSVPLQTITAYVRSPEMVEAVPVPLAATPQVGDPTGQTSAFEGQLPLELVGSRLLVVVPSITIGTNRYRFGFATQDTHASQMPRKVTDAAERELYLTPGGKYSAADIQANGSQTASQRYRAFRSEHDMHPQSGEQVCPITNTKSNPKCTWVVNGKRYSFCCPPCIDEFVQLAKQHPEKILEPEEYVAQ
jgi:hypothetical protein